MNKLNEFLAYLQNQKRYSFNTVLAYRRDLLHFNEYCIKENSDMVDELIIRSYLAYLYTTGLKKRTIARKVASLKSYYKYLSLHHNCNCDFITNIKAPKKDKLLPSLIYKDELDKILKYNFAGQFKNRNKAIVSLLYSSGVRISELCNITFSTIDIENRYLFVKGKGNKTRICPFDEKCKESLLIYLEKERKNIASPECLYLFVNRWGNKLSPRAIENIIASLSLKLFSNNKLHPHMFRHTYATRLINNGADIKIVQELLGHSSLLATQIYTHLANETIGEIYKISHPRSERK